VKITSRSAASLVVLVFMGMLAFAWAASGEGKHLPPDPQSASDKAVLTPYVPGSLNCRGCHDHPENFPNNQLICRMTEYSVWRDHDRHQMAYEVLLQPRSREIAKRLNVDISARDNACVRCHGISIPQGIEPFQFVAEREGVTCVACHGPFQEWILEHQNPNNEKWRSLTRAQKEQLKGMRDLWDPRTRVETCLSCHVGDPAERKIITHDMYAAGHPPLPSIEVAAFSDQEPRHWQILREKDMATRDHLGFKEGRLEQTELVAIGSLVTLRTSLKFLTDRPAGTATPPPSLDFARYDCTACHHELVRWDRSWRQGRGSGHAPGQPVPPIWPQALARLGLAAADPPSADRWFKELQDKLDSLDAAMTERPFGNFEKAAPIACDIICWLEEPLKLLEQKGQSKPGVAGGIVDQDIALKMLGALGKRAAERVPDYESARQMAWAFRTIYHEWSSETKQSDKDTKDILEILNRLDRRLFLTLDPGPSGKRSAIVDSLGERLKAAASYNPGDFVEDFQKLMNKLPKAQQVPARH
jgi:Cytochrome c554 and c-prime